MADRLLAYPSTSTTVHSHFSSQLLLIGFPESCGRASSRFQFRQMIFSPRVRSSATALLPRAPDSLGRRLVSPSGDAWLWYFAVPVNARAGPPASTEQVTYQARGGDWIVTSGYRGNRIFYRRAMLACNNTKWRQIEFEYPASEKRLFDSFVTRTSYALRAYKEVGC